MSPSGEVWIMGSRTSRLFPVLLLLAIGSYLFAGGSPEDADAAAEARSSGSEEQRRVVSVFVSVLPQTYFVQRIGGETVEVQSLVSPGRGPATYEPSPRQVTALAAADLYFRIGVPFEEGFLARMEENLPDLLIVDSARTVAKRYFADEHDHQEEDEHDADSHHHHDDDLQGDEDHREGDHHGEQHEEEHHDEDAHDGHHHDEDHHDEDVHEGDHDHHAGAPDPHVWLGPEEVIAQLGVIRDTLIEINPEAADLYRKNYTHFVEEIRELTEELAEYLAPLEGESFYVYHPSFGYFGDAFGLEQVALETGGDEPTPAQLQRIIRRARSEEVRVVFVQPQFPQNAARRVAEAIDGAVVSVNHLNSDWFEMMRSIATSLREGLQ
jgi:zinc transport system substrate-binding protein